MDLRIEGGSPLQGEVDVPADKSITHRALILGALAHGPATLTAAAPGADNCSTAAVLRALGVAVEETDSGWRIDGKGPAGMRSPEAPLDCGNSGTTARLMAGVLAGAGIAAQLVGDASLSRRPMGRVTRPLRGMGGQIDGLREGERELLPLTVAGPGFAGGDVVLEVASAQVKSALLIAGIASGCAVEVSEPAASRDHTERMLKAMGAPLDRQGRRCALGAGTHLNARDVAVPGDFSSAAFLLVAGCIVPDSRVGVRGVGANPTRTGLLEILEELGADVHIGAWSDADGEPVCTLTATAAPLSAERPGEVPTIVSGEAVPRLIDELVVLAALAAAAHGTTIVRDAAELRLKESDRVSETVRLLAAFGITAKERADGFSITGPQVPSAATLDVSGDHRLALTAAVLALAADGESVLQGFDIAEVSFPGFAETIASLGGQVRPA